MTNPQLQQYIVAQEHAGFNETQIRGALAANGYVQDEIDAAFKELGGGTADAVIMEYVQQYARQGSTPVQIFTSLTQQGYPANKVRSSIKSVFGPGTKLPGHHAGVFFIIALFVAVGGLYLTLGNSIMPASGTTTPPNGQVIYLSPQEHITQIIGIARTSGEDAAVKECKLRLIDKDQDTCMLNVAILTNVNDDKLCDQIVDASVKDACLMNFIDTKLDSVCGRVQLRDDINTCNSIKALKNSKAAGT